MTMLARLDIGASCSLQLLFSDKTFMLLQVATEWLFSVPDHILHKHLASDPNTPVAEVSTPEDHRVFAPRRVPLQVAICFHMASVCLLNDVKHLLS